MKYILAILALGVAGLHAAPATTPDLSCHVVRGPSRLFQIDIKGDSVVLQKTYVASTGHAALAKRNDTKQQFSFFQCSPPKGYMGSKHGFKTGQVRSDKHPDLCLTIQGLDNRAMGSGYDKNKGHVSLSACGGSDLRRQWWSMDSEGANRLAWEGARRDNWRAFASLSKDGEVVLTPQNYPSSMLVGHLLKLE